MGNQIATGELSQEFYLQDLEGHTQINPPTSGNKFLKSVMCSNPKNLLILIKVFLKNGNNVLQSERDKINSKYKKRVRVTIKIYALKSQVSMSI